MREFGSKPDNIPAKERMNVSQAKNVLRTIIDVQPSAYTSKPDLILKHTDSEAVAAVMVTVQSLINGDATRVVNESGRVQKVKKHVEDDERRTLSLSLIDDSYTSGVQVYPMHSVHMQLDRGTNVVGEPMDTEWEELGLTFRCSGEPLELELESTTFIDPMGAYLKGSYAVGAREMITGVRWLYENIDPDNWKDQSIIMPESSHIND